MTYSSSIFLKLSEELHSLTALGRLLNSLGPIDVKKLYRRVLISTLKGPRLFNQFLRQPQVMSQPIIIVFWTGQYPAAGHFLKS